MALSPRLHPFAHPAIFKIQSQEIIREAKIVMNNLLLEQLQAAQQQLLPQFKVLQTATGALQTAVKTASTDKPEALAMQKALVKLQQAAALVDDPLLQTAVVTFANDTQQALDALAFEFARDLKDAFAAKGQTVNGRPPTLAIGSLTLNINIATRKAQWLYGKEELTPLIPLSLTALLKAYEQQHKTLIQREADPTFLPDLYQAWRNLMDERLRAPAGNRLNLVDTYSKMTMNRQNSRFWNAPSRSTFKDYPRPTFVRDLALAQSSPTVTINGQTFRLRLGVATKSNAGNPNRSVWLPSTPLEGEYYSDITFEEV